MAHLLLISGGAVALFVVLALVSQTTLQFMQRRRGGLTPKNGALAKLRTTSATYNTKFLGVSDQGWAFESLAHAIPKIRVGESAVVEVACRGGAMRFRSEVVEQRDDREAMFMRPPFDLKVTERRNRRRIVFATRPSVLLDRSPARLLDVGEGGARLESDTQFKRGERVKLEAKELEHPVLGRVLECAHARGGMHEVRIVFEEPVRWKDLRKKFAPAA
jgi:hypothetical protein